MLEEMQRRTGLKAPFPWFGGKSRVASIIWKALGDVPNYVEAFAGSLAVLLGRPHEPGIETANDKDGFICNAFRAMRGDPDQVAYYADWVVNECDLHARHVWLRERRAALTRRLEGDPDYYDAKIAGWWLWGIACWIGGGWCNEDTTGPWSVVLDEEGCRQLVRLGDAREGVKRPLVHLGNAGRGVQRPRVHLGNGGQGVQRPLVHLGDAGRGVPRKRVHLGNSGQGVQRQDLHGEGLRDWMRALSDRLARVRVCCGDWQRVLGPSPTTEQGLTGIFLDPPYNHKERDDAIYGVEEDCAAAVREWAIAHGDDPQLRIALCGYEGEHQMPPAWREIAWKAPGGYGNQGQARGRENAGRERLWLSPHCLRVEQWQQMDMFGQKN